MRQSWGTQDRVSTTSWILHPDRIKGRVHESTSFYKYEGCVSFTEEHKFAYQNNVFLSLSRSRVLIKKKISRIFFGEPERRLH